MVPGLPRSPLLTFLAAVLGFTPAIVAAAAAQQPGGMPEVLKPVAALPAHVAGSFQQITACQQTTEGEYFVFDRRGHSVFTFAPGQDAPRKLIEIGTEAGRVLAPTAFRLARDGSFAVADAPGGIPRVQLFTTSGSSLGGFSLPGRAVPRVVLGTLILSGIAALEYTGRSIFLSQPENGALMAEYSADGRPLRSFGGLRGTGQESDPDVHLALNSGLAIANPAGGLYFVFLAGVPQFRKYDAAGTLVFERHIEGRELDPLVQNLPSTWKRQRTDAGLIPLVMPSVYAAAAAADGSLWISTAAGVTYVYDADGEKRRTVEFRAAGTVSPTGLSFTPKGRLLVTPGCFAFAVR